MPAKASAPIELHLKAGDVGIFPLSPSDDFIVVVRKDRP